MKSSKSYASVKKKGSRTGQQNKNVTDDEIEEILREILVKSILDGNIGIKNTKRLRHTMHRVEKSQLKFLKKALKMAATTAGVVALGVLFHKFPALQTPFRKLFSATLSVISDSTKALFVQLLEALRARVPEFRSWSPSKLPSNAASVNAPKTPQASVNAPKTPQSPVNAPKTPQPPVNAPKTPRVPGDNTASTTNNSGVWNKVSRTLQEVHAMFVSTAGTAGETARVAVSGAYSTSLPRAVAALHWLWNNPQLWFITPYTPLYFGTRGMLLIRDVGTTIAASYRWIKVSFRKLPLTAWELLAEMVEIKKGIHY